jgi:hypothetical protein
MQLPGEERPHTGTKLRKRKMKNTCRRTRGLRKRRKMETRKEAATKTPSALKTGRAFQKSCLSKRLLWCMPVCLSVTCKSMCLSPTRTNSEGKGSKNTKLKRMKRKKNMESTMRSQRIMPTLMVFLWKLSVPESKFNQKPTKKRIPMMIITKIFPKVWKE